jgi:hypothetical protein
MARAAVKILLQRIAERSNGGPDRILSSFGCRLETRSTTVDFEATPADPHR